MLPFILSLIAAARVFFQSRTDTAVEVLALRQQVAVLKRRRPRPPLRPLDRLFWTLLRVTWSGWKDALVIVVRGLHPLQARLHYSTGRVAALLNKPPRSLSEPQQKYLQAFLRFCPEGHRLRRLLLRFRAMLRWRNATRLSEWIESAAASRFPFLAQFGKNLLRDWDAVERSITTPWNNGAIEGHINRLKAIKRQMYGRAGLELLKARVLPWILPAAA